MNYSNYRITLDVRKTVSSVQLTAKKGDAGRKIYITLSDKGSPCQIKEGCYAVFAGVKPDGTLLYNRTTIEDNTIIYDMTQQTTAVAGLVACEVKLFDSMSNLLTSPKLTILVDDVVVPDDEIVSMDEVTALTELILDARATRELANQIIEECNAATASANTATQNATTATNNANTATAAANAAAGRAETAATKAEEATEDTRAFLADANTVLQEIRDVNVASSVVCEETGSVISLTDASDNVLHGLKICGKTTQIQTTGKNLCPGYKVGAYGNSTGNYGQNSAGYYCTELTPVLPGINYALSVGNGKTEPNDVHFYRADKTWIGRYGYYDLNNRPDDCAYVAFNYYSDDLLWVQVEKGSTATAYEPYAGGIPAPNPDYPQALESVGSDGNIGVTVCGKNLWSGTFVDKTINGVTFKANSDGSVSVSGTASGVTSIYATPAYMLPVGTYKLSGAPAGSSFSSYDLFAAISTTVIARSFDGTDASTFTLTEPAQVDVYVRVPSGAMDTTKVFYPMIRLASDTDSSYEPYKDGGSVTLSTPNGLPGIPVSSGGNYMDENGQQWICDEIDFTRGKYVQRVATAENLSFSDNGNTVGTSKLFRSPISNANFSLWITRLLCTHLPATNTVYNSDVNGCFVTGGYLYARIPGITDTNTFNTKMQGAKVVYEMTTPIETDLSADELSAFAALHSNKPNTTVFNDSGAYMDVEYVADTKTYIDNKFNELAAALVNNI